MKFYTKWCVYCRLLSPEYDKLVDIITPERKDILIARLEAGANDITSNKYGINQFPIVALFEPGSKKIKAVYQGIRDGQNMANWINQLCPKIEIKEEEIKSKEEEHESLEIDINLINNGTELTDKKDFIKQELFKIKRQLDEIEQKVQNRKIVNKKKKNKYKKIRITFDFSFTNVIFTLLTLLIIMAFYKTGRKLLINAGQDKE